MGWMLSEIISDCVLSGQYDIPQTFEKVPRPPNSFILYRQHHHHAVHAANPGIPNPQISRIIANMWKAETPDVRGQYKALAERMKQEHALNHPEYHFTPRRPRDIRRRAARVHPTCQASDLAFLAGTTAGNAVLATQDADGNIAVTTQVIDCLADHGYIYGPNGLAPIRIPDANNCPPFSNIVEQQINRRITEPVQFFALDGTEFGPTFPESEVEALL